MTPPPPFPKFPKRPKSPGPQPADLRLGDDALLVRGLDAFRADCARPVASGLAARVLDRVRRGDVEEARFVRIARAYSVAAAVLVVVGVGGGMMTRRSSYGSSAPGVSSSTQSSSSQSSSSQSSSSQSMTARLLDDLVASRLARELAVTLGDHRVGGR